LALALDTDLLYPQSELRSPDTVMKLERMGSFFPTRLSFMRSTIRRLAEEKSNLECPVWEMDDDGYGRAVYTLTYGGHRYSLVAFSTRITEEMRTDRVIAEVWDTAYVLYDGVPTREEIDRLEANSPRQEAGRFLPSDLVLSRANKSVRLFEHVTERLAAGKQPDEKMIGDIGYLMRTTAVYGNGKFGIADRSKIMNRPGLSGPFQAEMLAVWLIRNFTHDLVEYVAQKKAPQTAVRLEKRLKRYLGIGNSTGLGMAPFLVNHPVLLNNWMSVRETALARVCAIEKTDQKTADRLMELFNRVSVHLQEWNVPDQRQMQRIEVLRTEWEALATTITSNWFLQENSFEKLVMLSQSQSMECQELVVAMLLEPHGDMVDGLTDCMASEYEPRLEPSMTIKELRAAVDQHYDWALTVDFSKQQSKQQFWYVSEEKLEPRLGDRFSEDGAELELPHDIALLTQNLVADLDEYSQSTSVAEFLLVHSSHRYVVKRIQTTSRFAYAEIRDNLVGDACLPIDMLRCKLSFFGASKFDPKSSRWTRITMYQGAPLADDLHDKTRDNDDWWLPVMERA